MPQETDKQKAGDVANCAHTWFIRMTWVVMKVSNIDGKVNRY